MEPEVILQRFAQAKPVAFNEAGDKVCSLCPAKSAAGLDDPANHDPECPWRLASEHVYWWVT